MTEAKGSAMESPVLYNGVSRLNEIPQQTAHTQRRLAVTKRTGTIARIPLNIIRTPDVIALLFSKITVHIHSFVMALHIAANIEDTAHQRLLLHTVTHISLIIEYRADKTVRTDKLTTVFLNDITPPLYSLPDIGRHRGSQVILENLAHIIVNSKTGIERCQFLAFSHHGHDTPPDNGTAGIHLTVLRAEDNGEMFRHTLSYTMVLTLPDGSKVSRTLSATKVEPLHIGKHPLTRSSQLTQVMRLTQRNQHILILTVATQPPAAMPSVM